MARDPTKPEYPAEFINEPDELAKLNPPANVDVASRNYYAQVTTYQDGHVVVEWYKRGPGAGVLAPITGAKPPPDAVFATSEGPPATVIKEKYEKEQAEAKKPDPTVTIGGVPNVVIGQDANGRDIYGPVQTATGPAQPSGTAAIPADATPRTEGTPTGKTLPDGTPERDNTTPIMVWRRPDGTQVKVETLDAAQRTQWEREQNAGGKSDAEIRAEAAKAAAPPQTIATNTTEPFIVQQGPDGKLTSQPNPNYKGPEAKPGTNIQVKGADGKTYVVPVDAQGNVGAPRDLGLPGDPATRDETPIINPSDKKTYIRVTTKDPTTGLSKTVYLDPQTRQEVTLPGSAMAGITGLPSYTPDLTKPGAGLIDRAKQLDEMMAAGQLTWEQRQEILGQDQVLASTVANEFNAGVSLLQTNYANQTSQRNVDVSNVQHRASLANSHMQNAIGLMEHFAPYLGNTKGATGKLFMSAMAAQLGLATQYGGMQNIAREQMDPAVAAWAHRAVAGAGGPGAPGAAPGGLPAPGAPPAAPGVPPVAPGLPGQAPAPALGPARNRFDTGPGNTLGPRVMTPRSSGMPPPPQGYEPALSWRAGAQQQEDLLLPPDPNAVGTGEMAFGSMLPPVAPTDPMGGPMDFGAGAGVGPSPLAMQSAIPGLTPEQDEQARRELDRQIFAGARG